jgi:stress response protein SCP2
MKEIIPMGSVFNEVEPSQGIVIMENGKTKYGSMNLSRKQEGMMTLEEYRAQKEFQINLVES